MVPQHIKEPAMFTSPSNVWRKVEASHPIAEAQSQGGKKGHGHQLMGPGMPRSLARVGEIGRDSSGFSVKKHLGLFEAMSELRQVTSSRPTSPRNNPVGSSRMYRSMPDLVDMWKGLETKSKVPKPFPTKAFVPPEWKARKDIEMAKRCRTPARPYRELTANKANCNPGPTAPLLLYVRLSYPDRVMACAVCLDSNAIADRPSSEPTPTWDSNPIHSVEDSSPPPTPLLRKNSLELDQPVLQSRRRRLRWLWSRTGKREDCRTPTDELLTQAELERRFLARYEDRSPTSASPSPSKVSVSHSL
ncbi:hypothetical protein Bbelb_367220 [Branchiostoma belcheri]|nr:hypothetical protein Bbelb_367220 [Branchiostoma belcheri]